MEIHVLEVFTEYCAMISCLCRISQSRLTLTIQSVIGLFINFTCAVLFLCYPQYSMLAKLGAFACILVFAKYILKLTWLAAVKYFGLMLIMVSGLQLLLYILIGSLLLEIVDASEVGIVENGIIIFIFAVWKRKYVEKAMKGILWFKECIYIILFFLFFSYCFYVYNKTLELSPQIIMQTFLGLIGIILVIILWLNTEREKKRKAEELRAYELYTKSFEETIMAIRMKQHEFKNHINAILCMQYTIEDDQELKDAQRSYCQEILKDNSLNDLLKAKMSPVIIGYLYSKFTSALEKGISVKYDVQDISLGEKVAVHDLIEVIGILFDNAVEALTASELERRQIYVRIGSDKNNGFFIEIANTGREYHISEIESFFEYGASSKGEGRGVGLYQAKKLVKKYNGLIDVNNVIYDEANYLSFKILFQ